jgi:hypothetical protein
MEANGMEARRVSRTDSATFPSPWTIFVAPHLLKPPFAHMRMWQHFGLNAFVCIYELLSSPDEQVQSLVCEAVRHITNGRDQETTLIYTSKMHQKAIEWAYEHLWLLRRANRAHSIPSYSVVEID